MIVGVEIGEYEDGEEEIAQGEPENSGKVDIEATLMCIYTAHKLLTISNHNLSLKVVFLFQSFLVITVGRKDVLILF